MITLHIHLNNRTEYRPMETLWGANLVAIGIMRNAPAVNYIDIIDNETGEVYRTYKRG